MERDLETLNALIGITEEDLDQSLYYLSEKVEEGLCIRGIWSSEVFRNYWKIAAQKATSTFLNKIHVHEDGSFCLQVKRGESWEFIYDDLEIRKYYFKYLAKKILDLRINTSIMELINIK